ncbi:MAG TPA: carbohydrate ABC transporter permease [Hypericibacter adhaerens]|jgi:multiple sugar transport system permease protein|uniref:Sugar ABC transporter permease n=1 Tax=Hypericibacter adhaerens TaxID=2602016 RepID=A0A5J6MWQ4_9PROT|nr:carbohydrate ABC transporter permease [Hypericibacter adhaerens]QEX21135.1 sugar ABC transporter permease [Hypericibacter adhaerens]HWA44176.1 carbohydrate ABC transporter permease [Hypericibacter adhaerens]
MPTSLARRLLRDATAVAVVAIFMFPLFWWALTSFKPTSAIFNKDEVVFFDFTPTLVNYQVTLLGKSRAELAIDSGNTFGVGGGSTYDSRQTIVDSIVVAVGATALTILLGVSAAYSLSRMRFRGRQAYLNWVLSQRFMPPIAIIVPIVFMFHYVGLRDTLLGLILIDTLINLPLAVLMMKSFFDDVPVEVDEAAMIDGATRFQIFWKVVLPLVAGGVAATAVLCFIFSWTEFLLSLFLTTSIRTLPVKISTFVTSTGSEWGFISALGTSAIVPSFIFILLVQKQLVRGLTLGSLKE